MNFLFPVFAEILWNWVHSVHLFQLSFRFRNFINTAVILPYKISQRPSNWEISYSQTIFNEIWVQVFFKGYSLLHSPPRVRLPSTIGSLWPSDAIWRQGSRSTLVQVMTCCLTATSHYLNQCWLIIGEVHWHSSQGIILRRCEDTNQLNEIENCSFKMIAMSHRGQWVNYVG